MEKRNLLTAAKLTRRWLDEQFPNDYIDISDRTDYNDHFMVNPSEEEIEYEIMVDGVGIGELHNTTLYLIDPKVDICTVVTLENPESLPILTNHVKQYLYSTQWGTIMSKNKAVVLMIPGATGMQIIHRSIIGYNQVCK